MQNKLKYHFFPTEGSIKFAMKAKVSLPVPVLLLPASAFRLVQISRHQSASMDPWPQVHHN